MISKYKMRLNFFVNYLDKYILPDSREILKNQISSLIRKVPQKRIEGKWKFEISPNYPVKFYPCDINGNKIQVDFSCSIDGSIPPLKSKVVGYDNYIENYTILIRIWSLEEILSLRNKYDSDHIMEAVKNSNMERVILRFHIDKRKGGTLTEEPLFHMNFGGISYKNEFSWFPKTIDVPRFYFFPMDFVLATEFILMNFYSNETYSLREEPEWKAIVNEAQELFLKPCVNNYYSFINDNTNTFLKHLVNWKN